MQVTPLTPSTLPSQALPSVVAKPGAFDAALAVAVQGAPPLLGLARAEGSPEGNPSPVDRHLAQIMQTVDQLGPALLPRMLQWQLDMMAKPLAEHGSDSSRPDHAALQRAYFTLVEAGATPVFMPADRLRATYEKVLAQRLSGTGYQANITDWQTTTAPDWNPSLDFGPATRGADGQGFATLYDAMLAGAGRAAQEQNRPTQPFAVEAEHGYLVAQAPNGRFYNFFVRGDHEAAAAARRLQAAGAPHAQTEAAVDNYRLGTNVGPLVDKLRRESLRVAGFVHTHPQRATPRNQMENTDELPSSFDHWSTASRNTGPNAGVLDAVVFKDAQGRLAMTIFETHRLGNRLDITMHTIQNKERPDARVGSANT